MKSVKAFMAKPVRWPGVVLSALAAVVISSAAFGAEWVSGVRPVHVIFGHDGTDQQVIRTDANGNVQVEFGTTGGGLVTAADDAALTNALKTYAILGGYDGATIDMLRTAANGLNSVGTGLLNTVPSAQCDDTSPQAITENSFGNLRLNCTDHALLIGGPAADDAAASGNPVPIGCKYNSTQNTVEEGDISYVNCTARAELLVQLQQGSAQATISNNAADDVSGTTSLKVHNQGYYFDGTNWDRTRSVINATDSTGTGIAAAGILAQGDDTAPVACTENQFCNLRLDKTNHALLIGQFNDSTAEAVRGNRDITVLASAARTATNQSSDLTNTNGRGLHCVIDATAAADTPSVVFTIQGKDALSGKYYTILASAAVTGISTTVLRVFPSATAAANTVANDIMPRTWRVDATHADADSLTYSVGCSVVVG